MSDPCFQCDLDIPHVCYRGMPRARWGLGDEAIAALDAADRYLRSQPLTPSTLSARKATPVMRYLRGQIVRLTSRRTFRIGIITQPQGHIGAITGSSVMLCVWINNSNRWSQPQEHELGNIAPLTPSHRGRRAAVIRNAIATVVGGTITHGAGKAAIGVVST